MSSPRSCSSHVASQCRATAEGSSEGSTDTAPGGIDAAWRGGRRAQYIAPYGLSAYLGSANAAGPRLSVKNAIQDHILHRGGHSDIPVHTRCLLQAIDAVQG